MRYQWRTDKMVVGGHEVWAECECVHHFGNHFDPPEDEIGEPQWHIDGAEVSEDQVPLTTEQKDQLLQSQGEVLDDGCGGDAIGDY